ncbi:hypothetical protein F2P79_004347 [Pimephales promelas]|nr:hypothetical protein F2P79_004347 [Pimephales promelas]
MLTTLRFLCSSLLRSAFPLSSPPGHSHGSKRSADVRGSEAIFLNARSFGIFTDSWEPFYRQTALHVQQPVRKTQRNRLQRIHKLLRLLLSTEHHFLSGVQK